MKKNMTLLKKKTIVKFTFKFYLKKSGSGREVDSTT